MLINQYSKLKKDFIKKSNQTPISNKISNKKNRIIKQEFTMWNIQRSPQNKKKNIENEYDIIYAEEEDEVLVDLGK